MNETLKFITPEHDTPLGLVHPYWARKPLNIINEIIASYSTQGDLICDPFVGSGMSVFATLLQRSRIIASDINPLSIFLTQSLIDLSIDQKTKIDALDQFLQDFITIVKPWFHYKNNLFVERERFQVDGTFEYGNFQLHSTEIVLKEYLKGRFTNRQVVKNPDSWAEFSKIKIYLKKPIDFEKFELRPNSRIAIPAGANLSHFFEQKNQAAINVALKLLRSGNYGKENENTLMLLISASLGLLRLSDKKASSQWVYWRPKNQLTSRNPIFVFQNRNQAIKRAVEWIKMSIPVSSREELNNRVRLINSPIQNLIPQFVQPNSIDFIITDPPYSDQAPYLEYSSLWIQILGFSMPTEAYKYEIVKTDAPDRVNDSNEYTTRLGDAIYSCSKMLKPNGIMVWFYQDHKFAHWKKIWDVSKSNDLSIIDVIPFVKQRRSIKTVTAPGKTLDGDLIIVFQKKHFELPIIENIDQGLALIKRELEKTKGSVTFFDKYAIVVRVVMINNFIHLLANEYSDVRDILTKLE